MPGIGAEDIGIGFPSAEALGNMFQVQVILGDEFQGYRDVNQLRALNPALRDFDRCLAANTAKIPALPAAYGARLPRRATASGSLVARCWQLVGIIAQVVGVRPAGAALEVHF